jgi:hypothetical protein
VEMTVFGEFCQKREYRNQFGLRRLTCECPKTSPF